MNDKSLTDIERKTQGNTKSMKNWSRVIVETDEKNPKLLAVITNDDCETVEGLRVRFKPSVLPYT